MKYFSKYLPVEGEIKEGDITFWEEEGYFNKQFVEVKKSFLIHAQASGWKKYKLFLCSKDIQVGDEVIYENTTYKVISDNPKVGGEGLVLKHEVHPGKLIVDQFKCIKVIGEISSEATWVKDGDEFDESELKKDIFYEDNKYGSVRRMGCAIPRQLHPGEPSGIGDGIINSITKTVVYIKGSCEHFH